jgi:hypothetical protein
LATIYDDKAKGHPPVAPAQLCLTLIVQAYTGACVGYDQKLM